MANGAAASLACQEASVWFGLALWLRGEGLSLNTLCREGAGLSMED